MVKCEVLIGHLFHGHKRCAVGEVIEMDTRSAEACARARYVKVLPAETEAETTGDAGGDGQAKPKGKGGK